MHGFEDEAFPISKMAQLDRMDFFCGSFLPVARLVYEQTYLTWSQGPVMVGYSTIHASPGYFVLGALSVLGSLIWLLANIVALLLRRITINRSASVLVACTALVLVCLAIPYSAWQTATVAVAGPGRDGSGLLVGGAHDGNARLVRLLLNHGISANDHTSDTLSPLMLAAKRGNLEVVRLLIAHGADLSEMSSEGYRAIDYADNLNHTQIVRALAEAGSPPPRRLPRIPDTSITVTP